MYSTQVPPELNSPHTGGMLIVGRDPGKNEVIQGRPFVGKAGSILDECLASAGIKRSDINITNVVQYRPYGDEFKQHSQQNITQGLADLRKLIKKTDPGIIVTLGNEASYSVIPDWPSRNDTIHGAKSIFDMRGYLFESKQNGKVIPSVHPAAVDRVWVPWRQLLEHDLKRAKEQLSYGTDWHRPIRRIHYITKETASSRRIFAQLRDDGRCAFDIEIFRDGGLACIGFAQSSTDAYVCSGAGLGLALRFLADPGGARLCAANGQFDIHYLYSRCGIQVQSYSDDTQLGWHACYPELAGRSDHKSFQATRKSLSFLGSMFTWDEWWKDYAFQSDQERWDLNGKDCMITYDIMQELDKRMSSVTLKSVIALTTTKVMTEATKKE